MQLEFNTARLYIVFRDICSEDSEFWWQLVIEENNHAALIHSGMDFFKEAGFFPAEIIHPILSDLQKVNSKLISLLAQYENTPPSRAEAFNTALEIERSAGEIHFQYIITKSADSRILKLFQELNKDDKDHIKRIQAYMKTRGIQELT